MCLYCYDDIETQVDQAVDAAIAEDVDAVSVAPADASGRLARARAYVRDLF